MQPGSTSTEGNPVSGLLTEAMAQHRAGRHVEAERLYKLAVDADQCDPRPVYLLGCLYYEMGQSALAVEQLGAALALDPELAPAHHALGLALKAEGRYEDAIASYTRAVTLKPDYSTAYHNLGNALAAAYRYADAVEAFSRAVALNPQRAESRCGMARALHSLGRLAEAKQIYAEAQALAPHDPATYNGLGMLSMAEGKSDVAIAFYDRAITLDRGYAEAFSNMAVALLAQGKDENAIFCCRRAIELNPSLVDAHFNLSLALLRQGDLQDGWAEYEWRRRRPEFPRHDFPVPEWRGEALHDRTILLYAEQGYGDVIQFARYAGLLAERGARVVLSVRPPLVDLVATVPGVAEVVPPGAALPPFDVHLPLMSLPFMVGTRMDSIPANVPYVKADPAAVAQWERRLQGANGLNVGLAWAGASGYAIDRRRSIPVERLGVLADIPNVTFISLQKSEGGLALDGNVALPLLDFTAELNDFAATAALMTSLDLVVTVDTAVAHLAGALAKPVWVMSRYDNDWRWFRQRPDSPWYPTARLFYQDEAGDWAALLSVVRAALLELAEPTPTN